MATKPKRAASSRGLAGHNSAKGVGELEVMARDRQIAAQRAWFELMKAQIEQNKPWASVLNSAMLIGIGADKLREQFQVSPSTLSRWLSGFSSPSTSLRSRLGPELAAVAEGYCDSVNAPESK